MKGGQQYAKAYGIKVRWYGQYILGNTLGTWATYWEPIENLKGTHWEQEKNGKKNPSSSQQNLGWALNSNLIQFPWPQGISLLQNGPFCEEEGPMPDFAGLHRRV